MMSFRYRSHRLCTGVSPPPHLFVGYKSSDSPGHVSGLQYCAEICAEVLEDDHSRVTAATVLLASGVDAHLL